MKLAQRITGISLLSRVIFFCIVCVSLVVVAIVTAEASCFLAAAFLMTAKL